MVLVAPAHKVHVELAAARKDLRRRHGESDARIQQRRNLRLPDETAGMASEVTPARAPRGRCSG